MQKETKLKELKVKLQKYENKLAERRKAWGEVVRTRFGDSFEDQVRDDTNALELLINSIKEEIKNLIK